MILREYQLDIAAKAVHRLRLHKIAYLAMEVRTGKTTTALHAAELYGASSVLFLTKKKAIASIEGDYQALGPAFSLTVTNYEQMGKLRAEDYDLVIIDEAQNFGAFPKPAGRCIDARYLCAAKPIIYLSGTPSPESYCQMFHQMAISSYGPWQAYCSDPKRGFNQAFYRWAKAGYVNIRKKRVGAGMIVDDYSQANADKVWADIQHLFITFTQQQAGFSAPVDENTIYVKMQPKTERIAHEIEKYHIWQTPPQWGPEKVATANGGADLINKLAQVWSGTLIYDNEPWGTVIDPSKASFIRERFHGQKIAIFYRYKAERELLKAFFPHHTESPEQFNTSNDMTFLGQVQSAREGVNLSTADALVMYNIDFSATSYFQARARIQSKDRQGSAPLFWIFADGGIEDKIYKAVTDKQNFTYSYYAKNVRGKNTGSRKAAHGSYRVAGPQAAGRKPVGIPGSVVSQVWPDLFH